MSEVVVYAGCTPAARVAPAARPGFSDQVDDLIEASGPGQTTEAARVLRRTVLGMWRQLMRPVSLETFLRAQDEPGIPGCDPARLRLQLADQVVNVVTALDYLLTLLITPPVTTSRLVLGDYPGADRAHGRADDQAGDLLIRRRLDARGAAVREGMRLLMLLPRDLA